MDTKKFALATLAGGVVFFVTGFLFYGLLLKEFVMAAQAGVKETPEFGILILSQLIFGAFLTMVLRRWPDAGTFAEGAKAGAVLTVLLALGFSLVQYATTDNIEAPPDRGERRRRSHSRGFGGRRDRRRTRPVLAACGVSATTRERSSQRFSAPSALETKRFDERKSNGSPLFSRSRTAAVLGRP